MTGVEPFGQTGDGEEVRRITLRGGGLTARVLTWGAVLQDLRLDGHAPPLVLGFPDFAPYPAQSPYFGATAARVANRIRDGHLALDGRTFQLDRNFLGKHHLHGGARGAGKRIWQLDDATADTAHLSIILADGEMGYPGTLRLTAAISLPGDGALDIRYTATTDATTPCNPAHHSYFVLDDGGDVRNHTLRVAAQACLPVDPELIPTGEVAPVAGTRFDFRDARPVASASDGGILDHNFCLSDARTSLRPVAWLQSPRSGLTMEIQTTEPGLQVYDGAKINTTAAGLAGKPMGAHAGIALEPQVWPDANHHPHFPQAVLRPGETYSQHSRFVFSRAGTAG